MSASRRLMPDAATTTSRRRLLRRLAGLGFAGVASAAVAGCSTPIRPPDPGGLARSLVGQAQKATGAAPAPSVLYWITPISPPSPASATPAASSGTPTAAGVASSQTTGWAQMLSPWQVLHPSITVIYHVVPPADLFAQQLALARSGEPGDVAYTDAGRELGQAAVLDPLDVGPLARKIVPVALDPHSAVDQIYALPVFVSALGLYVNQALLQAVNLNPTSPLRDWSSFETTVRALTNRSHSLYGFDVAGSGSPRSGQSRYAPFLWSAGGGFFSDAGDKAIWDETPGLDALIYLARLSQNYATPGSAVAEDATLVKSWLSGQTAALLAGPELTADADGRALRYNVQSIPAYIQGQSSSVVLSAGAVGVFARSRHKDWALDLVRYLASKDAQVAGLTSLRLLPANVDAGDAAPVFQSNAALGQFLRILREDDVHAFPVARSHAPEIEQIFQAYLGVALQGHATPRVAWTRSATEATALLKAAPTPTASH